MDWVSGTPVSALSPSQGCLLSQHYPNSREALAFVYYGVAVATHIALPSFLEGVPGLGLNLSHRGCALQPRGMGSEQVPPQAAAWLSALGMAQWLPNKLAVASAGAGAAGVVLPGSRGWNDPSSVQEHPRLDGC